MCSKIFRFQVEDVAPAATLARIIQGEDLPQVIDCYTTSAPIGALKLPFPPFKEIITDRKL